MARKAAAETDGARGAMRMRVIRYPLGAGSVLKARTIVVAHFDGVHLSHQNLLQRAVDAARSQAGPALALDISLSPSSELPIESLRQKLRHIGQSGCERVILQRYTPGGQAASLRRLVKIILTPVLRGSTVFAEPHLAEPILRTLHDLRDRHGVALEIVAPVMIDSGEVSVSALRAAITGGDLPSTHRLLGRDLEVCGRVRRGFRRGHTLGFPTANLRISRLLLPPNGVYAVRVRIGDEDHLQRGVANLGVNPTFGGSQRTLESHLFDFHGDLYGRRITVQLVQRLREERKFSGVEELGQQIRKDAEAARAYLA